MLRDCCQHPPKQTSWKIFSVRGSFPMLLGAPSGGGRHPLPPLLSPGTHAQPRPAWGADMAPPPGCLNTQTLMVYNKQRGALHRGRGVSSPHGGQCPGDKQVWEEAPTGFFPQSSQDVGGKCCSSPL